MKRLLTLPAKPLFWGVLALALFLTLLAPWAYPGSGTTLMTRLLGLWTGGNPSAHPLVALLMGGLGKVLPASCAVAGFNVATAIVGALCVWLTTSLAGGFFRYMVDEPRSKPVAGKAAGWATALAGLALLLSPELLRAATHFQWQTFDLLFILCATLLLLRTAETGSNRRLVCAAFAWGLIAPEAPLTVVLAPIGILALGWSWICANDTFHFKPLLKNLLVPAIIGAVLTTLAAVAMNLTSLPSGHGFFISIVAFIRGQVLGVLEFQAGPWILVGFLAIAPFVLSLFAARDLGANRRAPAILGTYAAIAVLVCLSQLPIDIAPRATIAKWNDAWPVGLAAMMAFAAAFVGGAGALLVGVRQPAEGDQEWNGVRPFGAVLACIATAVVVIVLVGFGGWATIRSQQADRPLQDLPLTYADRVLSAAGEGELWLLGDGVADPYLALRIAETKRPIVLLSLTQEDSPKAIERIRGLLETSPLFKDKAELREKLQRSLDIKLFAFLQDWIKADEAALDHFIALSLPDIWYVSDRLPLPENLWYRGAKDRAAQHAALAKQSLKLDTSFPPAVDKTATGSLRGFAAYARRQSGFVANNTAFYLADANLRDAAYDLFKATYAYDPDNVSALFNLYELIHAGAHPEAKEWCDREIDALMKQMGRRRYRLWALARTYGYIRSPQIMSALAGAWAMSGQTGAALSGLDLAWEMMEDDQRVQLKGAMAALYSATPGRRPEAIRRTQELLAQAKDPRQSLAYLRDLMRLQIMEGNLAEAKKLLEEAEALAGKGADDLGYERALWCASAGDATGARLAIEAFIERKPKNADALALLATLQLQANELTELKNNTLPKILTAAGTEDDYFYRIITAQIAEKENNLAAARASYLRALALKPEVHSLRSTILVLDMRLRDKAAAQQHAKQFLYQDRTHPLTNYVMGSLALSDGDLRKARDYLIVATDAAAKPPLPEAFNDLAEVERRLGRWPSALAAAQRACELAPKLPILHETVAAALLGLGRTAEAHAELDKAEALEKELNPNGQSDPRIAVTRARVYAKEGQKEMARVALSKAKPRYEVLDPGAKADYDAVAEEIGFRR